MHYITAYIHTMYKIYATYIYRYTYVYTVQANICTLKMKKDKSAILEGI